MSKQNSILLMVLDYIRHLVSVIESIMPFFQKLSPSYVSEFSRFIMTFSFKNYKDPFCISAWCIFLDLDAGTKEIILALVN